MKQIETVGFCGMYIQIKNCIWKQAIRIEQYFQFGYRYLQTSLKMTKS